MEEKSEIVIDRNIKVKVVDMTDDMQRFAIELAKDSMEKFSVENDIAATMKKVFDTKFGRTWHCVVGRDFGSYVTYDKPHFIYFYVGETALLLYKTVTAGK